jgi:uncharacterized protein YuzE
MTRTSYDPEADAFHARFAPEAAVIVGTEEVAPGVMTDFDDKGDVVGLEVIRVSRRGRDALVPRTGGRAAQCSGIGS